MIRFCYGAIDVELAGGSCSDWVYKRAKLHQLDDISGMSPVVSEYI
jgi:hypothetical protein